MTHESPTTVYFSAAVNQILAREKHGGQANLARRARVSTSYLNDLLAGRKPYWPDPIKERIAHVCGFSVSEMLEIGEQYVKEGVFWPHGKQLVHTAARSADRMAKIWQLAAADVGIGMGQIVFTAATMPVILPQVYDEYKNGNYSDAKMYDRAIAFCTAILNKK